MNKKFLTLCAIATAFIFTGCQKEKEVTVDNTEHTHSVVFTAEKAGETRTAIASEGNNQVTYKWISGDDERMHIYEQATGAESATEGTITSMDLSSDGMTATFHVTFDGDAPTVATTYTATYAGKVSSNKNAFIPDEQSPTTTSFDPKADVLIADPIVKNDGREENPSFQFKMNRKVSVNKMTLKNLPAGKVITSVTFESDKYHVSYYNPATGNYSSEGKKITIKYTENNTVPSSGEFPVYFTTAPVTDASFMVTVYTADNKRYVKSPTKTITFEVGKVRRFGVDLDGCEASEGRTFTLVEDVNDLVIGSNIVIAANGVKNTAMSIVQNNNNRGATDATKSSDGKTITITEQVQVFSLEAGANNTYVFHCVNGTYSGYIYAAGSNKNNYLKTEAELDSDGNGNWAISISDKEATITAQGTNTNNILRFNSSSSLFSCYSSGQQTVYLYQAEGLPSPGMSWSASTATATITSAGVQFTPPTLTLGNASNVTYSSSKTTVATIDENGTVTIVGAGETVISAIFVGNNSYAPSTVTYTLTVTDSRDKVATPTFNPAAGAVDAGTVVTISTETAGATIYYTTDGSAPTTASTQGNTVTIDAAKTVKAIAVKENYIDSDVATADYTLKASAVPISTILSDNEVGSGKAYAVAGVTVMAKQGSNYVIADATGVMLMYGSVSPALEVGSQYDVQGDVKMFNGVHEFTNLKVQTSTGTAPAYGTPEQMTAESLTAYATAPVTKYATVHVTAPESGYVCSDGTNNVNVYNGTTATFSDFYGKPIVVTGYLIGYKTGNPGQINILATAIEVDVVSFLTVSPRSLNWEASEYGESVVKSIEVSIDDAASGYSVSGVNSDWTVTDNGSGVVTVYPKTANASTTTNKVLNLTITHDDDDSLTETVICTQAMVSNSSSIEFLPANMTAASNTAISASNGPIYLTVTNGTVTSDQIRIFKGQTITISSESKTITKIEFTCTASGASQYGPGCFEAQTGYSYSGTVGTWTGSSDSVSFKASTNQVRATSIKVYFE